MNTVSDTKLIHEWVQWPAGTLLDRVKQVLKSKQAAYTAIKAIPDSERTFENTVYAIESTNHELADCIGALEVLLNMHPDEAVRLASRNAIEYFQNEIVDIEHDPELYRALTTYENASTETLEPDAQKLLSDMIRDYRRMGFDLPAEEQDRLKKNMKEMAVLETEFSQNINQYEDHIVVAPDQTQGLPESYLNGLKKDGEGNYIVTLDYPDYFPFIEQADVAEKREELVHKNLRKGGERNMEILKRVLELREENAKLLRYESHAAYILEVRMAKTPATVDGFLQDLVEKAKPGLANEFGTLAKLKAGDTNNPDASLAYYDRLYYYRKLKTQQYQLDNELLKEYFPLAKVKQAMLELYSEILSIKFERCDSFTTWHETVEWYQAVDSDGQVFGYFALDFFPRPNKYGHAAVFPVQSGRVESLNDATYRTPVCVMACNFPAPTDSNPSLLTHEEVETLFHEFGHVCHVILTKARFSSQSGTSTARDFVEAPSQMLENWVWDREMLKKISGHYKDPNKPMPDDLIEKLLSTRHVDAANFVTGQVLQAQLDFTLHTAGVEDPAELYRQLMKDYFGLEVPEDAIFPAGFGHLMGYDAGYYGYMWSKVYASDMFTRFKVEGLLNAQTGREYRDNILAPGSSRDEFESVKAFLKREPGTEAFFQDLGLL